MKKLILSIIAVFLFAQIAYASDRVIVQVQFKKALWVCPVCGLEEVEDRPMEGGASYEHTCKNGHKFNQSGSNMKEYNGSLSYPKDTFDSVKTDDISKEKQDKFDEWIYQIKNPPPYVEPTKEQLEAEKAEIMKKVNELQARIDEKDSIR